MRSIVLALALVVVSAEARAGDVEEARALYEQATALADEGRWKDAVAKFEQSAARRPHATTSYNLGYCERALGHATRARKHFANALARDGVTGGLELSDELRVASQKYRDEMSALIASLELSVEEVDVVVTIDGAPVERDGARFLAGTRASGPGEKVPSAPFVIEVDPGAHEIVVTAKDGRSRIVHETLAAAETKRVRVVLPAATVARLPKESNPRRTWGYVLGGVGIVGLGLGTYFGLSARAKWTSAKEQCPLRAQCSDDAVRLASDAHSRGNVATVAFVAGGAALVSGTILVLTSSRSTIDAGVGPRGSAWIAFRGSF